MPFLRSSTRPQAVECFFCLSPSLLPPQPDRLSSSSSSSSSFQSVVRPVSSTSSWKGKGKAVGEVGTKWNWHCGRCGCWNIRDERGEMVSDLPAMHTSTLNAHPFSLRATPSSSHLPSTSGSGRSLFCHSCLANQTLIMNMLANYLPDEDDPTFASLYASLPTYIHSLHSRYPPVCSACQPAVDNALRKADHRAQVEAWGSALQKGASSASTAIHTKSRRGGGWMEVLVWRARGVGFCATLAISLATGVLAMVKPFLLDQIVRMQLAGLSITSILLSLSVMSVTWIAWDPYWLRRVRSRDRMKVKGREAWVRNMFVILAFRIATSAIMFQARRTEQLWRGSLLWTRGAFALELILFLHALISIRINQPVAIQLVRPVHLTASSPPTPTSRPHSTTHPSSLAPNPFPSGDPNAVNPIFGQPSLHTSASHNPDHSESMDWEPSPPPFSTNTIGGFPKPPGLSLAEDEGMELSDGIGVTAKSDWDNFGVGKQRMFPGQTGETGLESLLAGWGLGTGPAGMGVGELKGEKEAKGWFKLWQK